MALDISTESHAIVLHIQSLLTKIDRLRLPVSSRQGIESIRVLRVTKEMDRALPWQQGHSRRTATLAVAIGKTAGLSPEALHTLKLASLLHDIGLLTLPSVILSKPTPLDSDTYMAVQCHPRVGAELLAPFHFLREASVLIAHHHERWDGSGYPYGLRGNFIPPGARILSIADAFDAIDIPGITSPETRTRVAYRILTVGAGTQFDPDLVEMCGRCLEHTGIHRRMMPASLPHDVESDFFRRSGHESS